MHRASFPSPCPSALCRCDCGVLHVVLAITYCMSCLHPVCRT
jgi:hypothetical protein